MPKEKKEKILERLDQYRAIEINNLWQRSVFLGTFLILGYTGYGFLVDKIVSVPVSYVLIGSELKAVQNISVTDTTTLHFLACALACINILFSTLWIAMAKGSKAWYEVYENAINFVENTEKELTWKEIRCEIDLRRRKMDKNKCEDRNDEEKFKKSQKDDCLFSTKAGGYSPAKINIAIGQVSLVIWIIVLLTHFLIMCHLFDFLKNTCDYWIVIPLIFILLLLLVGVIFPKWIKSSYFSDNPENESKKCSKQYIFLFMLFIIAILFCCIYGLVQDQKRKKTDQTLNVPIVKLEIKELRVEKLDVGTIKAEEINVNEIKSENSTIQNTSVSTANISSMNVDKSNIGNISTKKTHKEYSPKVNKIKSNSAVLNNQIPNVKEISFFKTNHINIIKSKCDSLIIDNISVIESNKSDSMDLESKH